MNKTTLVLTSLICLLACGSLAQGNHNPERKKNSSAPTIGLSYGWSIGDGGLKNSLYTFHLLFAKQNGRYLEFETQYYRYSDNVDYHNADGMVIGVADVIDWHIESRMKYVFPLIEWKRLVLHTSPYAALYYRQGEWVPRSPNAIPNTYEQFGIGLGIELRTVYNITERLGLYTAISYQVLELYNDKRHYMNPILPEDQQQSSAITFDMFGNRLSWTLGALYSFG